MSTQPYKETGSKPAPRTSMDASVDDDGPARSAVRGPVLPRLDVSKLKRHLPELRRVRIEINGVLAGCPEAIPDAVPEFAVGWAFFNRFLLAADQLGKISSTASHVSLMIESGVDLDRLKYESLGWIPRQDKIAERLAESSERVPKAVPIMTELDAISTCSMTFRRFDDDGAKAGYVHVALSNADDVLCVARDVTSTAAAQKIFGWILSSNVDCAATMLVVRGIVDDDMIEASFRAGIPIVATDAVPTAAAIVAGETTCTSVLGLALSYRRGLFVDGGHLGGDQSMVMMPEEDELG